MLLYELLTGTRAQEAEGLSIPEIERIVVRTDLARPSEVVDPREAGQGAARRHSGGGAGHHAGTAAADAARRSRSHRRRRHRARIRRGATRRRRRWPRISIATWPGGRSSAREESAAYRIGKFVRRRWPVVAAAAVFMVLLAVYAVTVTIQARQVAAERDRAREAQATAEEVTAYLVRMFQASDPSETRGDTITAKELLATGVARADTLSGHPLTQAQLLDVIGRVYQSLGRFDEARPLIERALATRRTVLGPADPLVGDSLTHLGDLLILQGRYAEAGAGGEGRAGHPRRDVRPAERGIGLRIPGLMGAALASQGGRENAKALLDEALAIRRRVLEPDDPAIAQNLSALAFVASNTGNFAEMESRYVELLAILRRAFASLYPASPSA